MKFAPVAILLGVLGALIHFGTAILRLDTFWPFPRIVDFASFYAAGWALRWGESPYVYSAELIEHLATHAGLPFSPPRAYGPPILYAFFCPWTWFSFPVAAWLWVLFNLGLLAWASRELARLAGVRRHWVVLFPLVVTFGPVFLDLTLGQVSSVLLVLVLIIGRHLRSSERRDQRTAGIASALAAIVKLYPLSWLGALLVFRRFRSIAIALLLLAAAGAVALAARPVLVADWLHRVESRVLAANERPAIDDQSLAAWLDRMGRSQRFRIPGLSVTERQTVTWTHPWEMDPRVLRWLGYGIATLVAIAVLWVLWRQAPWDVEAGFYLWVLVSLIAFPHIARYNHTLLLPAMACLASTKRRRGITLVALAYFLAGLARLTHLWARILPAPWAPLLTGSGLFAVLLLMAGLARKAWVRHA